MTASPASRKSAERQRRKDAGEVRVEVWLTKQEHDFVSQMAWDNDDSVADIIKWCISVAASS